MRIWTTGLGKQELVLDFFKSNVTREGDTVFIRGIVQQPVNWNFEVTLTGEDVSGLLRVIFTTAVFRHFIRNIEGVFRFVWQEYILPVMGVKPNRDATAPDH
ncbi:MAG: hypothetical protein JW950_02510 [Deltaproteobacteria bacterium]|nr:hypothetical protein [Deltaproteobacteria bacterium]